MSPFIVGIIGIVILVLGLFSGMPVAFVMSVVGFLGFIYLVSAEAAFHLLAIDLFNTLSSYSLTVIPMFILMGSFAFYSGASSRLYNTAYAVFGQLHGGLAIATTVACAGFGAVCGSGSAGAAAMGKVALPEMKRRNYDTALATGCVAAGGPISGLIPPSAAFIIYGIIVSESIPHLFMSGILPGILQTALFALVVYVLCRLNPKLGPAGGVLSFKNKLRSLGGVSEMAALFIVVMGGLFIGVFTPTEAGAIGAAGALVIALIRRGLTWQGFIGSLTDTARITAMLFLIVFGAMVFGHFLAVANVPYILQDWLTKLNLSPVVIIWLIILIYMVGGCFIDALAMLVLTVPVFYPVVVALGFDPIWFGVIIVITGEMGAITPPVGMAVYVISGVVPDVPIETIFRGIIPFLIAEIVGLALIVVFPQIALLLPNMVR